MQKNNLLATLITNNGCIFFFLLIVFVANNFANHPDVDSLGTLWVFTIDNSGSMEKTKIGNKYNVAKYIDNKLYNESILDSVNYDKDTFLFFNSGHLYKTQNEATIATAGSFDTAFIHFFDKTLNSFFSKDSLIKSIKTKISLLDYAYNMSFVSQIRIYSVVKAMDFLQKMDVSENYKHIKIITITDDSDQEDLWQRDYWTIKKRAYTELLRINETHAKYNLYGKWNEFGKLEEKNVPHIWVYDYKTNVSLVENADSDSINFKMEAFDGRNFVLTPLQKMYKNDSIVFFNLDSVIINGTTNIVKERFFDSLHLNLNYENGFVRNNFQVFGNFQVLYKDSIWGKHYKKYNYSQIEKLRTEYFEETIKKSAIAVAFVIIVLIAYLIYLPNRTLFAVYDNKGNKFVVKCGGIYRKKWELGYAPILSYVFSKSDYNVITKKSNLIKKKEHTFKNSQDREFLIVSFGKINISQSFLVGKNEISTKSDIDANYRNKSVEYKELLRVIYKKTLFYNIRSKLEYPDSISILKRNLLKVSLFILNIFAKKNYYIIDNSNISSDIRFSMNRLKNRTFIIERSNEMKNKNLNIFQNLSIQALNEYYNGNKFAEYIIGVYKANNYIYYIACIPEFLKEHKNSLKYANCIFEFKQRSNAITDEQIEKNVKALKQSIKKQLGKDKFYCIIADSVSIDNNMNNFEITEPIFPAFLYLQNTTEKAEKTLLYSSLTNGITNIKWVQIPKTKGSHLYYSFCLAKYLKNINDCSLYWKISNDLFDYDSKETKQLEIKREDDKIFVILDPHKIELNKGETDGRRS